jgi:MYXO-CTERM domain-containing protein
MAFSVSTTQTVLWDQIRYTGNPADFAWVLPVKAGAQLQLSSDAWIASLDASTQTVVQAPASNCPNVSGGGCAFAGGASNSALSSPAGGEDNSVQVISESVVGPYDAVTLKADQGQALGDWLRANGYAIPDAIQPTIDAYTNEGFDFIALKLRPGQGVQAMQPVRVVTPGAGASLPLRMVSAGIGPNVGIVLFILGEGRYHPQNFPDATIDFTQLVWDPTRMGSNYETLATAAMAASGGSAWLTESAAPAGLNSNAYYNPYSSYSNPSLAAAYAQACMPAGCDGGAAEAPTPPFEASTPVPDATGADGGGGDDGSLEAGDDSSLTADVTEASSADVTEASAADAVEASTESPEASTLPEEASTDAQSQPSEAGQPVSTGGGSCTATSCDDLTVAMNGIDPGSLWVTRLRAFLPASALSKDLVIEAGPSQDPVPSFHVATTYTDPNYNACPDSGGCECRAGETKYRAGDLVVPALGALLVGLSLRRRTRR